MKSSKKGFTIAELIVVIIILSILATLGFVTFSGYSSGVRDANRVAQITGISSSLKVYNIKNFLPLPDNYILLEVNGEDIAYQGYAGKDLLEEIDYKKGGKDPKDEQYYSYYITKSRKNFQLLAFLSQHKDISQINLLNKTYASDYSTRVPYVDGNRLGMLLEIGTNKPIQEIDSIAADKKLDLGTTIDFYRSILNNEDIVEGDNTVLADLKIAALAGGKGCTGITGNIVCTWSGSSSTPDTTIVGNDITGREWSNGTYGQYCDDYRHPSIGYAYSGDVGNGVYWIDPSLASPFRVYCDMSSDGGGWTYSTMISDTSVKNFLYTENSNKITSITSSISSKGRMDNIWLDAEDKDLMFVCQTLETNEIQNYETAFFVYGFKKADIGNLTKASKEGTIFSSVGLNGKWNGVIYALATNYGDSTTASSFYINKDGLPGAGGYLFMLRDSQSMRVNDTAFFGSLAHRASGADSRMFDASNYCMSAIR